MGINSLKSDIMRFGNLVIDFKKHTVFLDGNPVDLTTMEFESLSLFARNPGRVLNRDQILEGIKGMEWEVFNRSVDVLMSRLRQKLSDDPKNPSFFKTVWGTGYLFIAERT